MITRSLQPAGLLSKLPEFLQAHFSRTPALLREESAHASQGNASFTQRTQALRHVQQTYSLERRCFL